MKKLYAIFIFVGIVLCSAQAQKDETIFNSNRVKLTGVWAGSTNGFVKFRDEFSLNNGGFLTFEFNKNFLIGWSGYGGGTALDDGREVDINGNDLLLGYGLDSYKSIHPFFYLKTGAGELQLDDATDDNVFVIEPSVGLEANVFRWFRMGIDAGYRFVSGVDMNGLSSGDVSSPFVSLRLKFGWSWGKVNRRRDIEDFD